MPSETGHTENNGFDQNSKSLTAELSVRSASSLDNSNHRSHKWRQRPKSTPVSPSYKSLTSLSSQKIFRPLTATVSLGRPECDRVHQLEHEPTRQHRLESHLPLKRMKQHQWQKCLEPPLVNFQIGHGYILSRSKTANHVTIADEFFEPILQESFKKQIQSDPARDSLIVQLQEQISDLTLFLEEERLNHKQTKQKAEDLLKYKVDEINLQFQDQIRDMVADHKEELLKQKLTMEAQHQEVQDTMEAQIRRMAKDIELIQSAFESYKGTLHMEATQKLSTKEEEQRLRFEEEKQQAVHEMRTQLIQERNQERLNMIKEHQKAIDTLRKGNKKEMDILIQRFSSAAADIQKLKEINEKLEETKLELETVKESYNATCQQLTNITSQLTDAKVRLVDFQERFEEKVSQVDDRYKHRLQELMTQNTELKRLFVQKCGELFDQKADSDNKTAQRVKSAKEVIEVLVKSKQRANLSIALNGAVNKVVNSKSRPLSAPGTRQETASAHETAGEVKTLPKSGSLFQ